MTASRLFRIAVTATLSGSLALPTLGWAEVAETTCHRSPAFLVIGREQPGESGAEFLARPRQPGDDKICLFQAADPDLKIGGPDVPLHFTALEGTFLVLDGVGGSSATLVVYDLVRRAKVLDAPVGDDVTTDPDGVSYWERTADGTQANCPEYGRHHKDGFASQIETRVRFSFKLGTAVRGTQTRCRPAP